MMLYHATLREFEIGTTYFANEDTPYLRQNVDGGISWVDLLIDDGKPPNAPCRQRSFFACHSIQNCYSYINSRYPDRPNEYRFYEVEMQNPVSGVMCLTDLILKLGQYHTRIGEVVNEYWRPTKGWKYLEYLSAEMKVVKSITPGPIELFTSRLDYISDKQLSSEWSNTLII